LLAQDIRQAEPIPVERWTEDARLHDGRVLKVERETSYSFTNSIGDAGSGFAVHRTPLGTHRLRFRHPDTGAVISWWKPIAADQAPAVLRTANLSIADPRPSKGHLSVEEVQQTIERKQAASHRFFQREIPTGYDEWRYLYKNSHRNQRQRDDCRPPRVPPPAMVLPAPFEGSPAILETITYAPDRIASADDWSQLVYDRRRDEDCKKLFRPTDPDDDFSGQRFVQDPTGTKPVPYSPRKEFDERRMR
jgi:hypothetical protein